VVNNGNPVDVYNWRVVNNSGFVWVEMSDKLEQLKAKIQEALPKPTVPLPEGLQELIDLADASVEACMWLGEPFPEGYDAEVLSVSHGGVALNDIAEDTQ
jgi:hypothetical protein